MLRSVERPHLPRRAFLGIGVRETEGERGLAVTRVLDGSMAALVGLRADDEIVEVNGVPADTIEMITHAVRAPVGDTMQLWVRRRGSLEEHSLPLLPFPEESVLGSRVDYGAVEVDGARLRVIQTVPERAGPHPTVFFLQGMGPGSVDYALREARAPVARLIAGWAANGFGTVRVEPHGMGDSDPAPSGEADFEMELAGFRAALEAVRHDGPRYLFGHSVGGMHAPLLAREYEVDGILVYGTSAERWSTCLRSGLRRQLGLRGVPEAEIAERMARFDADPLPAEGLHGRCAAYHQQLDALDLKAAWRALDADTRVLHGEYDWVVGDDEVRAHAALVGTEPRILPRLDHAFTTHASRQDSLRDYGYGDFGEVLVEETVDFVSSR